MVGEGVSIKSILLSDNFSWTSSRVESVISLMLPLWQTVEDVFEEAEKLRYELPRNEKIIVILQQK